MDVAAWLQALGLEVYAPAFRDNDIDLTVLQDLTEADLAAMGIRSIGHCRKLSGAISALRQTSQTVPLPMPAEEAERRQITIMFCDMAGSTALSTRLDPEDLRTVVAAYLSAVTTQIQRMDGFIARYMGDGVLAYFGYPRAHEDDAERAARAGLAVLAAVERLRLPSGRLQARIGLATGRVVVGYQLGEGPAQEQAVVGETPNLAARLQEIAAPGTMVVAASTRRLLGNLFRMRDLGARMVKGIAEPVGAWQVDKALAPQTRFEATRRAAAMVGRIPERQALVALRRRAWAGQGQILLLTGEPGIGKSRLAAWLCDDSSTTRHRRYRYQCSQYHRDSPLYPMTTQLRHVAGLLPSDDPAERLRKLAVQVAQTVPDPAAFTPLLAALLEIPGVPLGLTPAEQRTQTLGAFTTMLAGVAGRAPVLILFEDMHWADATSLELLDQVADMIRDLPVLVVVTARPEATARWLNRPNASSLVLDRLDEASIRAIVANAADLSPTAVQHIVARADGIPLFAEELTRTLLDQGGGTDGAVPDSLHDLLMARLDSLGGAKEVAQIGAVIGREFPYDLLRAVYGQAEPVLAGALDRLKAAGLVFCAGDPADRIFSFKHALVQDAAYDSLLRTRRSVLHQQIAEILVEQGGEQADGVEPEIVAQHYARAGQREEAVRWWSAASTRAVLRSAYAEAIGHFRNAIALIEALGEGGVDRKLLLKLHIDYGQALIAARGYNAPETFATFERAFGLATLIEDPTERFSAYYGLWSRHYVRGDMAAMADIAGAFLKDAAARPDAPESGVAHRAYGTTRWYSGDFRAGRAHLERAVAAYDPARDGPLAFTFGQDVGMSAYTYLAFNLWPEGDVERACRTIEHASRIGLASGQGISAGYVHFYTALFHSIRLAPGQALPSLQALEEVTREHGLTFWGGAGSTLQGWALCRTGAHDSGMALLRRGLAAYDEQAFGSMIPVARVLQADVARSRLEVEVALDDLDQSLLETWPAGQHWLQAEMLRMRGELLRRRTVPDEAAAEAMFEQALAVAQAQGTRAFALRAAVSLARLLQATGRGEAARPGLAAALAGFDPGPDFPEVGPAQALLARIGAG